MLNWISWNKTVYMYKMDLALNNLHWIICYKTKPNQTKPNQTKLILNTNKLNIAYNRV